MKISVAMLKRVDACTEAVEWFEGVFGKKPVDIATAKKKAFGAGRLSDCNWLVCRLLSKNNKIKYAIYAAKQVIELYEKQYPDDKRPREAIRAAEKYLKAPTRENAANAANAAAYAAYAAYAAAYAANAAAYAAYAAAHAANAAAHAANAAAYATDAAADAAMMKKILNYGARLLKQQGE